MMMKRLEDESAGHGSHKIGDPVGKNISTAAGGEQLAAFVEPADERNDNDGGDGQRPPVGTIRIHQEEPCAEKPRAAVNKAEVLNLVEILDRVVENCPGRRTRTILTGRRTRSGRPRARIVGCGESAPCSELAHFHFHTFCLAF
jgi:hypothetical protein